VRVWIQVQLYEDLGGYDEVKAIMEKLMALYNEKNKPLNLVFFEDALQHVARIMRTITLEQGNSLLVGVGGSGKQSLAKLAAYTARCGVFEITLSRGYDKAAFRDDLKVRNNLELSEHRE
jgi:dynein heavy chain, axonemal